MSQLWMSHVTHMNESCHTYECVTSKSCVMSRTWMSHVTYIDESCHTYKWVIWMSHVTHMNESWRTYEYVTSKSCVMSHTSMSHFSHSPINESRLPLSFPPSHFLFLTAPLAPLPSQFYTKIIYRTHTIKRGLHSAKRALFSIKRRLRVGHSSSVRRATMNPQIQRAQNTFCQKSSIFYQKSPLFYQKTPAGKS